jgi:hypothetical protein
LLSLEATPEEALERARAYQLQESAWSEWEAVEIGTQYEDLGLSPPDAVVQNNKYVVCVYRVKDEEALIHLSVRRQDRLAVHDWRDLQRIKNELLGEEVEAVELYPSERRCVDTANQYHLWAIPRPGVLFPFGYGDRLVVSRPFLPNAKQRPLETDAEK